MKRYYIQIKDNSVTVLDALIQNLSLTCLQAQKLIHQGSVWQVKPEKRIKDGTRVVTNELLRVNLPFYQVVECHITADDVAYDDKWLFVVYKKANVPVHPTPYSDIDSLSWAVGEYCADSLGGYVPSAINRLDKPTQGLVFFAKDKETERRLHAMFREHAMKKRYIATTHPVDALQSSYCIRDAVEWNDKTKTALTYVRFIGEYNRLFYYLVFPQTGRTHQIRQHFLKRIAPLFGDKKYGHGTSHDEMGLICFEYKFTHPRTGNVVRIRKLPEDITIIHQRCQETNT